MSDSRAPDLHLSGHCYCGAVTYAVDMPADAQPIFTAYCHCDSCRRAHAAPLYHVACVDEAMFRITAGAEALVEFTKPGGQITRAFCGLCGSKILNRFPGWLPRGRTPVAFFPSTLREADQRPLPECLRPGKNNCPEECVLDPERLREVLGPS